MPENCIFCKIVAGEIPATIVYEDDTVIAFRDINPQAPVHVLVVPRQHVDSLGDLRDEHASMAGHAMVAAGKVAETQGLEDGFRLIVNNGAAAGQTVSHLHLHILGGRTFSEGMVPA